VTRRVVVLAPEAIRPGMAGMGIRALEIAAALARRFDVRLLAPNDEVTSEAAARGVDGIPAPPGSPSFHREIRACDAARENLSLPPRRALELAQQLDDLTRAYHLAGRTPAPKET